MIFDYQDILSPWLNPKQKSEDITKQIKIPYPCSNPKTKLEEELSEYYMNSVSIRKLQKVLEEKVKSLDSSTKFLETDVYIQVSKILSPVLEDLVHETRMDKTFLVREPVPLSKSLSPGMITLCSATSLKSNGET